MRPEVPGLQLASSVGQVKSRFLDRNIEAATPKVNAVLSSAGASLEPATRSLMETRFGHNFSNVRIHADTESAVSAQGLGARAYTVGDHVVFGASEYAPGTGAGQWLIAHELAHTIQQTGMPGVGSVARRALSIGASGDRFEREAEKAADTVTRGEPVTIVQSVVDP